MTKPFATNKAPIGYDVEALATGGFAIGYGLYGFKTEVFGVDTRSYGVRSAGNQNTVFQEITRKPDGGYDILATEFVGSFRIGGSVYPVAYGFNDLAELVAPMTVVGGRPRFATGANADGAMIVTHIDFTSEIVAERLYAPGAANLVKSGVRGDPEVAVAWIGDDTHIAAWNPREEAEFIFGVLLDGEGAPVGPALGLARTPYMSELKLVGLAGDRFGMAWVNQDSDPTVNGANVVARVFDTSGEPIGPELRLGPASGNQGSPDVAGLAGGTGFIAVFTDTSGGTSDVMAQVVDASGLPVGEQLVVHASLAGEQFDPRVTVLADGRAVVMYFQEEKGARIEGTSLHLAFLNTAGGASLLPDTPEIIRDDFGDQLTGGMGADEIFGLGGPDWLRGLDGDDLLVGGSGRDSLDGGSGADRLDGGEDADYAFGGEGSDTIGGKEGDDVIDASLGNDYVDGGTGSDLIYGGFGEDLLIGGAGNDTLFGGEGSDVFLFRPGEGADVIRDFVPGSEADAVALQAFGLSRFEEVLARLSFFAPGGATLLQIGSDQIFFQGRRPEEFDATDFFFI